MILGYKKRLGQVEAVVEVVVVVAAEQEQAGHEEEARAGDSLGPKMH
jgi:hypothetical protein